MNIEELKALVESDKKLDEAVIIVSDTSFVSHQYINQLKSRYSDFKLVEDINELISPYVNLFQLSNDILYYYDCDEFSMLSDNLKSKSLIIRCKKLSKEAESFYANSVIELEKIEPWQIKDYVYSRADGVNEHFLDSLLGCTKDLFRLEQELNKISIFDIKQRVHVVNDFVKDGIFGDLTDKTIWDLSTAIVKRDKISIKNILLKLRYIDVEPMGLLTVLYNNFKNIIKIQLDKSATPESCNLKSNQFWAIKKNNLGFYTKEELVSIFLMLTDLDKKIKSGYIDTKLLIDYMIVSIL